MTMKRALFIAMIVSLTVSLFAQEKTTKELTRKERRELKKEEQKKLSEEMAKLLSIAIDEKQWVLEANTLANKKGVSVNVTSTLNFVAVEGNEAFIQLGSNTGMGQNGVGGVSVRGNVNKYEVSKNEKKGTYFITLYVSSALGTFDIQLDCNADGQIANATVQGNTSRRVQYRGVIVPLAQSTVYKGTPII